MNPFGEAIAAALLLLGGPHPPEPGTVLEVPEALLAETRSVIVAKDSPSDRLDRLVEFVRQGGGLELAYQARPTRSVADTYDSGKGNCLAFTLTFMALARRAGLSAFAREVHVREHWERHGAAVLSVGHVNVGVDTPDREAIVDFEPDLMRAQRLAQPFRGRRISDDRALAHFYNNRAAELMLEGRIAAAHAWVEQALALDAAFAPAWITHGVLVRRGGLDQAAAAAFERALEHDPRSANALVNLVALHRQGDNRAAMIRFGRQLEALKPRDPYHLQELARFHRLMGETEAARAALEQAVQRTGAEDPRLLADLVELIDDTGAAEQARRRLARSISRAAQGDAEIAVSKLEQLDKAF